MIRRAAVLVVALTLHSAPVRAQDVVFTVTADTADLYKGPTTVTPVIGHVKRGAVLPVTRNLGSWVRIPWPAAEDGVAYVHVTTGRIGPRKPEAATSQRSSRTTTVASPAASSAAPVSPTVTAPPAAPAPPAATNVAQPTDTTTRERVVLRGDQGVQPIGHQFGIGGFVGSMSTVGASARTWPTRHLGIQLDFSRDVMTSDVAAGRVTAIQFEPGVVFAFRDHVSDYVWIRPYAGSAVSFRHQTLTVSPDLPGVTDGGTGFRVFGGTELTFAAAPQLGLSIDLGYRRVPTTTPAFDDNRLTMAVAARWYVR